MSANKGKRRNPRLAALSALSDVLDDGQNLTDSGAFSRLDDKRDYALARHLAYGVLRWLGALDWLAGELLEKPLKRRDQDVVRLIWLGLQQLWHDQVASHAAVNETAGCARLIGKPWAVGLINAVLRRFQREQAGLLRRLQDTEQRFAHPDWLREAIQADWPDHWQAILDANNRKAPMWLRINRRRDGVENLLAELVAAGYTFNEHPYAADAVSIDPASGVEQLPGFAEGRFSVQDPAAQLAKDLLAPRPGEHVLDACAAPGGKTAHLLESCTKLDLLALDRQAGRAEKIRQSLARLGLRADIRVADASSSDEWWDGKPFDKILLDAPCTATGVIRRHPEIKWLRKPEQVNKSVQAQRALLAALWPLLKPGGSLVYATCSVLKCENSQQIQHFLAQHPDASDQTPAVEWGLVEPRGRQVLPGEAQMDGFFYAVLRKSA
ncbi:MAG: 16S rRNA (cytosine(967)-C(5))-methyltransferase RsmB [Xanthomonadales bacterium]|nr:16S rRNA (cytosine(967)-C(5))-methyltransferase RsmB [Xanthomonadales bacterium]